MAETVVISLQGIGNSILALPLVAALARRDRGPVDVITRSSRALPLLALRADVGEVFAWNDARSMAERPAWLREVRRRRYRQAVLAHPTGRRSAALAALAGVGERVGVVHPEMRWGRRLLSRAVAFDPAAHDLEHMERLADAVGAPWDWNLDWPPLAPSMGDTSRASAFLRDAGFDPAARYVGLHPGCDDGFAEKRWPERSFAETARLLHERTGRAAIVFDGPAEAGAGLRIAREAGTPIVAMNGWGNLVDALGMLAMCDLFVANDSGLMNLAAAAGVPTLAVFGPSETHRTRPWGPRHAVAQARKECVPCYGLGPYPGCKYPDHPCLFDITPKSVVATALEMLRR